MARNLVFGIAIAAGLTAAMPAFAASLTVTVEGVHRSSDKVVVGLFDGPTLWPKGPAPYKVKVSPKDGRVVYVFKDLKPGRYAVTGYDDENGDGKMDYSFIGIPEEGFFFSNNKSPGFGAPSFDDCAITVTDTPASITMHMQHMGG